MTKEIVSVETEVVNPLNLRSEKLATMAQLQQEISELESEQKKRKLPSSETAKKIHALYAEMEDMEEELSHVEEEISEFNNVATALDVRFSDLAAPAKSKKATTKKKHKKKTVTAKRGK